MYNCKPELMKIFSELTPENQRTLMMCARTACAAEKAAQGIAARLSAIGTTGQKKYWEEAKK